MLEDHLDYHNKPEDSAFVSQVMGRIRRQQHIRRLVLWGTGVFGAAFGAAGALMLSKPLTQAMEGMSLMPISISLVAVIALLVWLFHDETTATG